MKRFDHVMHCMLCYGDKECVQVFLDSSSESAIFLQVRDSNRKTTLILAACEKYPDIVQLHLEYKASPNVLDINGGSPLMEAAPWVRLDNVKHLAFGARKDLQDKKGLTAVDFAEKSDRNDEERFYRAGGEIEVYRENAFLANRERRLIRCLLEDPEINDNEPIVDTFQHYVFVKTSPHSLKLLAPLADYPLSTEWKTIVRLERGGKYPHVSAMSGWAHNENTTVVSGRDWTNDVVRISLMVGHTLRPDAWDRGQPGQYNASHAEKQLIVYFISKYSFLTDEIRAGDNQRGLLPQYESLEALRRAVQQLCQEERAGPLSELAKTQPPVMTEGQLF